LNKRHSKHYRNTGIRACKGYDKNRFIAPKPRWQPARQTAARKRAGILDENSKRGFYLPQDKRVEIPLQDQAEHGRGHPFRDASNLSDRPRRRTNSKRKGLPTAPKGPVIYLSPRSKRDPKPRKEESQSDIMPRLTSKLHRQTKKKIWASKGKSR